MTTATKPQARIGSFRWLKEAYTPTPKPGWSWRNWRRYARVQARTHAEQAAWWAAHADNTGGDSAESTVRAQIAQAHAAASMAYMASRRP